MRGVAGVVTDAGIRDSAEIAALDFPVYCAGPSAPLNLAHHHAVDTNRPIACGGVPVYPGDVVVGDQDGVVVVPRHLAQEIADDALEQERLEVFVMAERETWPEFLEVGGKVQHWEIPIDGTRMGHDGMSEVRDRIDDLVSQLVRRIG